MKQILILSKGNNARCQMLEAWLNYYGKGKAEVVSVGTKPEKHVNVLAIKSMMEAVIDISSQKTKGLEAIDKKEFDYLFTFENDIAEELPSDIYFKENNILELNNPLIMDISDEEKLKEFHIIRDIIEDYVFDFVNENIKKLF